MPTNISMSAILCAALWSASGCATSTSASTTTSAPTAVSQPRPRERGANSARAVIESFFSAVRADDADAATALLTERLRSARSEPEPWSLFWTTWRTSACELRSLDAVRDGDTQGETVPVEASVHLRCGSRERESTIRLERTGDRWLWNEN